MADEPILGLFDSDNNFLDELTGNGTDLGSVISSEGDGMLGQGMPPIGSTPQLAPCSTTQALQMPSGHSSQNAMMMGQSGGYQSMGPEGYGGMAPGPQVSNQYSSTADPAFSHSQYTGMPKMAPHHGDSMMGMGMQPQAPGGMMQQQQFGSPPPGGMIQQHAGYQGYNMPAQQQPMGMMGPQQGIMGQQQGMMGQQQGMMGPQQGMMGPQQGMMGQQQGMMGPHQGMMGQQAGGWNPAQTSPTGTHPQFMSAQSQQQAGGQGCMPQPMGQPYMGQHDYGMQQNMGHYGDSSGYMQQQAPMGSPGGMNMMPSPMQRPPRPQFQPQAAMRQPNPAMAGYSMQQGQRYPGDYMAQRQSMNPTPPQQRYPYPQSSGSGPQAMGPDGNPMGHFPNPNQPSSYMSSYPGTSHPTATASPRPPAVSQSLAGSHSSGVMGQASYGQSHLQELEQLVSPTQTSGAIPSANPYQQIMQSSGTSASNVTPHSPIYSSASFPTTTLPSSPTPVQAPSNIGMGNSGPLSPNMRQSTGQQSGIALEIQRLEGHIQQLFNMPQSQQISQQMLDAQERLRILKAQQQQQLMQIQRQQQQQQMNVGSPTRVGGGKPNFGQQQQQPPPQPPQQAGMNQQRPRMPGQMSSLPQSAVGPGGPGPMLGAPGQASQLQVQAQHMGQQISPQRPPSQTTPISSPQRIQPFQSPTSSTPGDGLSAPTPPSQPLVVQQAADSMTDPVQMTPPMMHSTPVADRRPEADMVKVMSSDPLPATVTEIAEAQEGQGEKPKRKRERKPKGDKAPKTPKEPKEKKPRTPKTPKEPKPPKPPKEPKPPKTPKSPKTPKTPKEPKEPKEKKPRVRKSKKAKEEANESFSSDLNVSIEVDVEKMDTSDPTVPTTTTELGESIAEGKSDDQTTPKKKTPKEKKPRTPKVKPLKKPSTKKRKPPASLFLKKRKRKRAGSDGSDIELAVTPPGSPIGDDDSNKRRSSRNTKRKKYLDDIDLNLSDDEHLLEPIENADGAVAMKTETEEDVLIVEKILGSRMRKRDAEELEEGAEEEEEEEEFLVKYKNYSFLHCEWRTVSEVGDKRFLSKIKRFKQKKERSLTYFEVEDEEYFNPDYVEVDRVLAMVTSKDPVTEEDVTHYLVKWRSLTYEESTWELEQDVHPSKVEQFKKKQTPPPEEERKVLARPKPQMWEKQEEGREYKGDNKLREYQLEGLNWLTFCWYNGQNCVLADEMGLGKTIQSITYLNEIYQYGIRGPFLVIVPLSTLGNWQREFETWTDMNAVVYHGPSNCRTIITDYELFYKDENGQKIPDIYKFDALITTYEIILTDIELLTSIEWRCCIIDEAHRLKNKNCRLLEGLRLFEMEHRVLLTGTPLQNNTEELFSLLNFLNPSKFSSSASFLEEFGNLKTESQVDKLKEILKPMMLRRLKEDVEKNLAPKEETIIEVELTNIQKKYYRAILERNFHFLSKGGSGNVPSLMNTMMELRKCCNHPYLINGAEEQILEEKEARRDPEQLLTALISSSGKMVLMDKLLPRLKQDGHKVLIFSQMIRVLDIIEDYLVQRKYLYERLDGRIRGSLRQEAIDRFSKPDSDRFAFLLCTRAGGLGINLTAADTVVIFDSDWNPQNDLQAQARCHRIGQSKAVKVYRLVTRNSYEREMFDKASLKLGLDKAVLQSMSGGEKSVNANGPMSKKEVEDLLKKGAYGALMEDDSAGDKFCEEDIDLILQRRTKVIQIESEGKGSTFAKASFSVSDNRTDIDINDPNFWQKWAKKADIDVDKANKKNDLIIQEPRQRRQTSRYGKEEAVMEISDLDSSTDSDDEMKLLRKGRKLRRSGRGKDDDFSFQDDVSSEGYTRSDCFKVEKHLLVYGWGRWQEIIQHSHFKSPLTKTDVETIARAILAHSLKFYKGDDKIKSFIWDLIANNNEGGLKNHTGLSAPVPRGRKGKKAKEKKPMVEERRSLDFDPEVVLDNGYKRHLHRHSNKVLLRVRLLYYIKQEVIGEEAEKVFQGARCHEVEIPPPICEGEIPALWWDQCADRCLLLGIFKHGYEKYNQIRQDPALCFLTRCGPPDGAALLAEQDDDKEDEDELEAKLLKEDDEGDASQSSVPDIVTPTPTAQPISVQTDESGETKYPFPTSSDITLRLRRIITGYQRMHKKMMEKQEQFARRKERREQQQLSFAERVNRKREFQNSRWSRREEADFYRTVSTFGVEFDRDSGRFKWDRFRSLARLDRKSDDTITEYFHAFYYMCQTVCGKFRADDRVPPPPNGIFVEKITEERASRCLARIDLLNKIRDDILPHPDLAERIKLCQQSFDMPSWWQCGKHDKELLIGAARHGVARTDYNILRDPELSFHEVLLNSGRHLRSNPHQAHLFPPSSASTPAGLRMSPALRGDLRDDDLESDSKSQDSMDLRDSRASTPPPLHNGKVQYPRPHPNTDTDAESEGPPKLERAVSPGADSVCMDGKKDGSTTDVASPADTIEAAAEPVETVEEELPDQASSDKCKDSVLEKPEQPSSKDSKVEKESKMPSDKDLKKDDKPDRASTPTKAGEEGQSSQSKDVSPEEVVSKSEEKMELSEAAKSQEEEEEKMEVDKEPSSVKSESHTDSSVKVKSEPTDLSTVKQEHNEDVSDKKPELDKDEADKKSENITPSEKEGSQAAVKKENSTVVKTEESSSIKTEDVKSDASVPKKDSVTVKAEEPSQVKEEKPDYVKLKEKIMQGELERLQREKLAKEGLVSTGLGMDGLSPMASNFAGLYGEDSPYLDPEGLEPGEIVPGRPFVGPAVDWPKDRVIFHRLERICYTVEKGKWPYTPYSQPPPYDSRSGTPVGSSTPPPENGEAGEMNQVIHPSGGEQGEKDFEVHLSQNEGLKMTFHKRGRGRGRGGSSRYDMDAEKAARVQQLLNQSAQGMASSDNDSQQEPINPAALHSASSHQSTSVASSPMRDSPMSDEQLQHSSMMEQGYMFSDHQVRRGRKRKAEKLADQLMAEALAKREQARMLASLDPEARVPVINLEDGSILSGEEAPRKHQLEKFLHDHPGYMVCGQAAGFMPPVPPAEEQTPPTPMADLQAVAPVRERRKPGRKPKLDPTTLYSQSLTGEENVSVVERGSGRKPQQISLHGILAALLGERMAIITGAKAPPLKHLKEWLEQNPTFDVEPKWGELLRTKGSLPPSLDSRLLKPSGRGRKPRNAAMMHSNMAGSPADFLHMGMAGMAGFPAAAGMMGGAYPKLPMGMPFANLGGLGMANPMLGLAAAGFPMPGFPMPGAVGKEGEEGKEGGGGAKDKSSTATSETPSTSSTASPHPSFPGFFFNPLAFNPMLAGQIAANFPMANFSNLAHMAALNGLPDGSPAKEELLAAAAAAATTAASTSRKEKASDKSHHPSKPEKGHDLTKIVEKIKDSKDLRTGAASTSSSHGSGGRAQDLSLKSSREATPSPAHSRGGSRPSSSLSASSQDQATDLSIRAKPCPSTTPPTPTTAKANAKNKIQKTGSLSKIVDTLKYKIEEKSKKKEGGESGSVEKKEAGADQSSSTKDTTTPAAPPQEPQPENLSHSSSGQVKADSSSSDDLKEASSSETVSGSDKPERENTATELPTSSQQTTEEEKVPAAEEAKDSTAEETS